MRNYTFTTLKVHKSCTFSVVTRISKIFTDYVAYIYTLFPLKDYELLFSQNNSFLHFTPSAVSYIAEEAAKLNLGVRGIHRILDSYMFDLIYHTDGQEQINVSITGKDMQENRLPRIQKFCYM